MYTRLLLLAVASHAYRYSPDLLIDTSGTNTGLVHLHHEVNESLPIRASETGASETNAGLVHLHHEAHESLPVDASGTDASGPNLDHTHRRGSDTLRVNKTQTPYLSNVATITSMLENAHKASSVTITGYQRTVAILGLCVCILIYLVSQHLYWRLHHNDCTVAYLRATAMSWRSAVLFVAMLLLSTAIPPSKWGTNCFTEFQYLAAWYAFLLYGTTGEVLYTLWTAHAGAALGVIYGSLLNTLMPGGATKACELPGSCNAPLLPGGYTAVRATICNFLFVHWQITSGMDPNIVLWCMFFFIPITVPFQNPNQEETMFHGVIWKYNAAGNPEFNWHGVFMAEWAAVVVASVMILINICPEPPFMGWFWRWFGIPKRSRFRLAETDLAALAHNVGSCLQLLLCREHGKLSTHEIASAEQYLISLEKHDESINYDLDKARWETWTRSASAQLRRLGQLSSVLKELKLLMRSVIGCIRLSNLDGDTKDDFGSMRPILPDFLQNISKVLHIVASPEFASITEECDLSREVESALQSAQKSLDKAAMIFPSPSGLQLVLFDILSHWLEILRDYAKLGVEESLEEPLPRITVFLQDESSNDADSASNGDSHSSSERKEIEPEITKPWIQRKLQSHGKALQISVGYLLIMVWCDALDNFRTGAMMSWSQLIFAYGAGSKLNKVINRSLAMTAGPLLCCMPWFVLTNSSEQWIDPLARITYVLMSMLVWFWMCHYCFLQGENWFTAMLAAVFGGARMVINWQRIEGVLPSWQLGNATEVKSMFFVSGMDVFVSCLVVLVMEILAFLVTRSSTGKSAANCVAKAISGCEIVLERIVNGNPSSTRNLENAIRSGVKWSREAEGEDRVWRFPWKRDLAQALLEKCSVIHYSAHAMAYSAKHCEQSVAAAAVKECVPSGLPAYFPQLHHVARTVLGQQRSFEERVKQALEMLDSRPDGLHVAEMSSLTDQQIRNYFEGLASMRVKEEQASSDFTSSFTLSGNSFKRQASVVALTYFAVTIRVAALQLEHILKEQQLECVECSIDDDCGKALESDPTQCKRLRLSKVF